MKKLIIISSVLVLLVAVIGCSSPDSVVGNDSSDQQTTLEPNTTAKSTETGYAEKPPKTEVPEPGTGP